MTSGQYSAPLSGPLCGIPGPGEQPRIVAINRTTGYTGTATMTLGDAARDDTLIAVFSEWLDEDDKPLPDGLGTNKGQDFVLTGRLAKLSGGQPAALLMHYSPTRCRARLSTFLDKYRPPSIRSSMTGRA